MVIGPGWGQDSVGTDGGVSILPDGSTVVGDYGETTVIKGNGSGVHTQLKSSDDAVDQTVYLTTKARTLNEGSVFFSQQTATKNQLWIGAGSSPNQILPVTEGKLVAHTLSYASGSTKLWWSTDGVNVGTNPAAPTSGRAFQVTTTAQASAFYVDDSDGTCHFPWSGNTSAPNVAIGAGSELRLLNTGAASYVYAATDQLIVYQSSPNDIRYQCANGGGGDHIFETRGSTEVGRFDANGLVLPTTTTTTTDHSLRIGPTTNGGIRAGENGASSALVEFYNPGSTFIRNWVSGSMFIDNQVGDINLQRSGTTRLKITSSPGVNIPADTADPTVDDQWVFRSDTKDLCIRTGGTVYKVTLV